MRTKLDSVPAESRSFVETARRAQIVDCAIDTIAEVGFAKASVDQIAKRAGVSKGVITYHFPNKEGIVDAIIEKVVATGRAYMEPRILAETSAAGRLRAYIESDLEFIDAHRKSLVALVEIAMSARRADGSLAIGPESLAQRTADMEELLRVDVEGWRAEVPLIRQYYEKFGDRLPQALADEVDRLEKRLG